MDNVTLKGKQEMTLISSSDGRIRYKLAHLRSLYVLSKDTPQEFCEKFNLDVVAIYQAIVEGRWEKTRAEYSEGDVAPLLEATRQQFQELYENELLNMKLMSIQDSQYNEAILRNLAQYGDIFLHDKVTGDLVLDHSGLPIKLELSNTGRSLKVKNQTSDFLEGLTRVLSAITEAEARRFENKPGLIEQARKEETEIDEEVFGKRSDQDGQ